MNTSVSLPVAITLLYSGDATFLQSPKWRTKGSKVTLASIPGIRPFLVWVQPDENSEDGEIKDPWGQMSEEDLFGTFIVDCSEDKVARVSLEEGSMAWAMNELIHGRNVQYADREVPFVIYEVDGPNGTLFTLSIAGQKFVNFRFAPKDFYARFESAEQAP